MALRKLVAHACQFVRSVRSTESISEDEIPSLPSLPPWCLLFVVWSAVQELVHAICGLSLPVPSGRVHLPSPQQAEFGLWLLAWLFPSQTSFQLPLNFSRSEQFELKLPMLDIPSGCQSMRFQCFHWKQASTLGRERLRS